MKSLDSESLMRTDEMPTLSQSDIEVWLQATHLAQCASYDKAIFREFDFLRQLGWNTGLEETQNLKDILDRLAKHTLTIHKRDGTIKVVPLLVGITGGGRLPYIIRFHPEYVALFKSRPACPENQWPELRRSLVVRFYSAIQPHWRHGQKAGASA
jgi:hypothetical protein